MLRTSLYAPLAGALVFASPAIAQTGNHPGDYRVYAEGQNAEGQYAEDDYNARQGPARQERDRYTDRRDDYRDSVPDDDERSENYTVEPDRTERGTVRDSYQRESSPSDYDQAQPARDSYQWDRPTARQYSNDRPRDTARDGNGGYDYPTESNRYATEEEAGDQPQPRADPAPPVRWGDRNLGQDPPTTYRGEPSRPDREEMLPQREMTPPAGTGGTTLTPFVSPTHSNYSSAETIWHVRAALNVAALGCRDDGARTAAAYNGMLSARRTALAAANAETKALYRIRFGGSWQQMHDTEMTKLYNFFAQPPGHDAFCRVARQVLNEEQTVPDAAFPAFANDALVRLEAPFIDTYRQADEYSASQRSWRRATS